MLAERRMAQRYVQLLMELGAAAALVDSHGSAQDASVSQVRSNRVFWEAAL